MIKEGCKDYFFDFVIIIICWGLMYFFFLFLMIVFRELNLRVIIIVYIVCIWLFFSYCFIFLLIYFFLIYKGKEMIVFCIFCLKNCMLWGISFGMGFMLLDSFNYYGGSIKIVGSLRNFSWWRSFVLVFMLGVEICL